MEENHERIDKAIDDCMAVERPQASYRAIQSQKGDRTASSLYVHHDKRLCGTNV